MLDQKYSDQLDKVFVFLKANTKYNRVIQNGTYSEWLAPCTTTAQRLKSLLFHNVSAQSQPDLESLSKCWQLLNQHQTSAAKVTDIRGLADFIASNLPLKQGTDPGDKVNEFERLWHLLQRVKGWGKKTSALFVKSLIQIHTDPGNTALKFLTDFKIGPEAQPYLPVDVVISHIFKNHLRPGEAPNFNRINRVLRTKYVVFEDLIVWDDLWFWGFITQRSKKKMGAEKFIRVTDVNMPKFWGLQHAPWDLAGEVEVKADKFLKIISV